MNTMEQFERFKALHAPGRPLILVNVWDAGSARTVAEAGALALATGSWAVAAAHGFGDGERLPLELALANVARIAAATALPVSLDIESGYSADAAGVGETARRAAAQGAIGCNLEDSFPDSGAMRPLDEAVARIRAARSGVGPHFFINARCDIFFQGGPETHDQALLEAAVERAHAYAEAGADGLFAPGLVTPALIEPLAARSPLPLNLLAHTQTPPMATLRTLGVARVSHGHQPYLVAMAALKERARNLLAEQDA